MLLSFIRTVILYPVLIFVIRLMGKRQLGQMEPSEFAVTMMVANLATIPVEEREVPLYMGLIPMLTVLGLELVLAVVCLRSIFLRKLLCGKPVILIENGNILQENLRRTRITLDELTGHLREKDVLDPRAVQYAILETNGNLSVFPFPQERPATAAEAKIETRKQYLPITIVSDGKLLRENLQVAGKTEDWVHKTLKKKKADISTTWLLTVDQGDQVIWYRKEEKS
jgi:uncharacterized membrane protein YcaP (DUF421 family)